MQSKLSESSGDVTMRWGVRIPMRDGIYLSANVYLPEPLAAPSPCVFMMTPYTAQRHHERGMYFASHGLCFIVVDVRGRGNSEGDFHPLHDSSDGCDVISWLVEQTYCNGKVAMYGGSYSGWVQWAIAKRLPRDLCTLVPVAAPYRGVDSPMRNNTFTPYTIQWLTLIAGRTSQDQIFAGQKFWASTFKKHFEAGTPFRQLDKRVGHPSPLFQEWLTHPEPDAYWDSYNPTREEYAQLKLPILTITGAYDADQPGALAHYRAHLQATSAEASARHYLIVGPWDHAGCGVPQRHIHGLDLGPRSVLDLNELHRQWYAWTMQCGPKPAFLKKIVAYYVTGAEEWRYADTLEEVTSHSLRWCLGSNGCNPTDVFHSGSLDPQPPANGEPDHFRYDPLDISLAAIESIRDPESLVDQTMLHAAHGRHLVYHSAPFVDDVEIGGFFKLLLWLAIDQPDTDIRAAVYEVALDGSAPLLSLDWLRARYREGPRAPKLIDTPEPLPYEFNNFTFVARRIKRGHRLRLVIGPVNSIYAQKNYNSGGDVSDESFQDARVVTVKLFNDEAHPSALHVPICREAS